VVKYFGLDDPIQFGNYDSGPLTFLRCSRLAELLVAKMDEIYSDDWSRLMDLLSEFDVAPGQPLTVVQIHRVLAQIGFLYVSQIKELIKKKSF